MADNVAITAGSGTTIATDDVAGLSGHVQYVKLIDATADSSNRLVVDSSGRIATVVRSAALTSTTGTITATGAGAGTVTATTDISSAGSVTVVIYGTYAGINATFEASPDAGTTWIALQGQRVDAYQVETTTGVLTSNLTRAWDFPMPGFNQFRVRATAYTSGTGNVIIVPSVLPFEVSPSVGLAGTPTAPTKSNASVSASSFTVLAANQSRRGAAFYNDSTATVYLDLSGGTASTTSYTLQLQPGAYYELPNPVYTGLITGIGSSATGTVRVTEMT